MNLIGTIIGITILIIIIRYISIDNILDSISRLSFKFILFILLLQIAITIGRAYRFKYIFNQSNKKGLKDEIAIVAFSNLVNNLLPAKTGEFSYVYYFKNLYNIQFSKSLSYLFIARFFDLISIFTISMASSIILLNQHVLPKESILYIILIDGLLICMVSFGFLILIFKTRFFDFLNKLSQNKLSFITEKLVTVLEPFGELNYKSGIIIYCLSLIIWSLMYLVGFLFLKELKIDLSFWVIIFAQSLTIITTLLPLQSFGNLGVFEGTWSTMLILFGITKESAITSSIVIHATLISLYIIIGIIGYLYMHKSKFISFFATNKK